MNKRWWKSFIKGDDKLKDGESRNDNRSGSSNVSVNDKPHDAMRAEAVSYDESSYRSDDMKKKHSVDDVYGKDYVAPQDAGVYGAVFQSGDILRSDVSYVTEIGVVEGVDKMAGSEREILDREIIEREGKSDFESDGIRCDIGRDIAREFEEDDEELVNDDKDDDDEDEGSEQGSEQSEDSSDEGAAQKGRGASKGRSGYVRVDEREDFDERDFPTCGLEEVETVYDLERGKPFSGYSDVQEDLPFNTTVESAKEFFATEVLYRFDLLTDVERDKILGSYRLELRGYRGGVWTLHVDEDLTVNNRREEADVVLSMKVGDFLSIVNGELNPQLSFLARRVKVAGNIGKAVAFQSLLAQVRD